MWIGIDIGGTAIKSGMVAADGRILARGGFPFDREMDFDALLRALVRTCRDLERKAGGCAGGVGIAIPGFADPEDGTVIDGAGNVPVLRGRRLPSELAARIGIPVFIQNDGVAATVGEQQFGAGRHFRRFVLVTIGTGIGGAVAIDGRIVAGSRGEPPELGAMVLDAAGPLNAAGLPGTFEHYACASAFLAAYRQCGGKTEGLGVADLFARAGVDGSAAAAIDAVCRRIAQALGGLVNALNLEACLIGGGVAAAGRPLVDGVNAHLADFTWPLLCRNVRVVPAETGNDAGLLGAAWLAAQHIAAPTPKALTERV